MGEDFYVKNGLWIFTIPLQKRSNVICIGCFEKRLGRKLTRKDFKPWFRNNRPYACYRRPFNFYGKNVLNDPPSKRLADRLQLSIWPMQMMPVTPPDKRKAARTGGLVGRAGFKCIAPLSI
jgi:hypothetical protein